MFFRPANAILQQNNYHCTTLNKQKTPFSLQNKSNHPLNEVSSDLFEDYEPDFSWLFLIKTTSLLIH